MYSILNIELKNFIGLSKISDKNNIFKLSLENDLDKNFFLLFGENGQGKTTLLESLTPYSKMLSRDIKKSIIYPAYKKIELLNIEENIKMKIEIYFESEGHTKGYIYYDDNKEPTIETSKGNITEFNFQVEKIFGDFDKFKNSLFLQQGVLEIVKATPNERIKIINNFISDLNIYTQIKAKSIEKIDSLKKDIEKYKEKQSEYKTFENKYNQLVEFEKIKENFDYETKKNELEALEQKYEEIKVSKTIIEKTKKEIDILENKITLIVQSNTENNYKKITQDIESKMNKLEVIGDMEILQNEIYKNKNILDNLKKIYNIVETNPDIDYKLGELEKDILNLENKITDLENKKNKVEKNLEKEISLSDKKEEVADIIKNIDKDYQKKTALSLEINETCKNIKVEDIKNQQEKLFSKINELKKLLNDIQVIEEELKNIDVTSVKKELLSINEDINELSKKLKEIEVIDGDIISRIEEDIKKNQSSINHLNTFINTNKTPMQLIEISENYEKRYKDLLEEIEKIKEIEKNKTEIDNFISINNSLHDNKEIVLKKIDKKVSKNDILELREEIEEYNKKLLEYNQNNNYVSKLKTDIEKLKENIVEVGDIEKIKIELEEYKKNLKHSLNIKKILENKDTNDTIVCDCCSSELNISKIKEKYEQEYNIYNEKELKNKETLFKELEKQSQINKINYKLILEKEEELKNKNDLIKKVYEEKKLDSLKKRLEKYEDTYNIILDIDKIDKEIHNNNNNIEILKNNIKDIKIIGLNLEELSNIKRDYDTIYKNIDTKLFQDISNLDLDILSNIKIFENKISEKDKEKNEISKKIIEKIDLMTKDKKLENRKKTIEKIIEKNDRLEENKINIEKVLKEADDIDKLEEEYNICKITLEKIEKNNRIFQHLEILNNNIVNNEKIKRKIEKEIEDIYLYLEDNKISFNIQNIVKEIKKLKEEKDIKINLTKNINTSIIALFDTTLCLEDIEKNIVEIEKNISNTQNKIDTIKKTKIDLDKLSKLEKELSIKLNELSIYKNDLDKSNKILKENEYEENNYKKIENNLFEKKKEIENYQLKLGQYKENKEWIEETLVIYKKDKNEYEENEKELYKYSKIKNYSDRIKKAFIGSFFSKITANINDIISNDIGTLGKLKIEINQTRADKFDILVKNENLEVNDISLLSGAEQATVARAIYFSLASYTSFGILWLDEYDGMLSKTNKEGFLSMLEKIRDMINIKQIFIISHNEELINKVDRVIYL